MAVPSLFTVKDVADRLRDFLSGLNSSASENEIMRAIWDAYSELPNEHSWPSLKKHHRVVVQARYEATCSYDHTGGDYERLLTLGSGYELPSWAEDAVVRIGDSVSHIESVKSTTECTLDTYLNPGQDVSAATECVIYLEWYSLPTDFASAGDVWTEGLWRQLRLVTSDEFLQLSRYNDTSGDPTFYCIREVPDLIGTQGLYVHPPVDSLTTLDLLYYRKPRKLLYSGETPMGTCSPGSVSTTAGSATVTGVSTAFESGMVGSVIRIGRAAPNTNRTNIPTGPDGRYPHAEEFIIHGVTSATSITVDRAVSATNSGVAYVVSDPIDLPACMRQPFVTLCQLNVATARHMLQERGPLYAAYQRQLDIARGADNRNQGRIVCGSNRRWRYRLSDGPYSADVE